MQRIAFLMSIKPGQEEEYIRRHEAVWPEMLATLKRAGVANYSIFRNGLQLFAYLEVADFDNMRQILSSDADAARWEIFMQPILQRELDPATDFPSLLPEVFHLD